MSIDQHMDQTEDERVESSSRLNIPLFSSFGPRGTQSKQDAPDWKLDHFDVCKAHKFPWPLVDKNRKCVVQTPSMHAIAGLFPREQEATCILDMLWPPAEDGGPMYAFLDINPTLKRIVSTRLENEVGIPKPDSSPWSPSSPTQLGSGHMLVRYKMAASDQVRYAPHKFGIRLVEAYECMRFIGWQDCMWTAGGQHKISSIDDLFGLCNLAGNSYSLYHWLPWHCALQSTCGKFATAGNTTMGPVEIVDVD